MANPFVSVVILTMGEIPERLQWCLDNQTYKNFEVLKASEKGIVNAMNSALDRAKGEIFVRIDDDVEPVKNWLELVVDSFKPSYLIAGVTGPTWVPKECRENRDSIRIAENPNWFIRWMFDGDYFEPAKIYKCGSVSYDSNFHERFWYRPQYPFEPDHLEGTNWAMRTELIREVGGFDPKFDGVAEWFDTDVEMKIKKMGYFLTYNPAALVIHYLNKGSNFEERFEGLGRLKNWLRFHIRHSNFHYKMVIWFIMMLGYLFLKNIRCRS